ncbi:YdiU family protein [Pleionea sp. CnH1-48]|uniref:protein adenylyltransferase SelO n=1 Tax=Pleionea sp. CnH1-48 TaxID=2954494 RepID=UPI002097E7F5|nr:YdiU family protein [Pleionea sp. CnH1-48]MCO7223183.1 YdiU family protein [Pleionea sp. CnH1-48]
MNNNGFQFQYDSRFVNELPGESIDDKRSRQTPGSCWSHCSPTSVSSPNTIAWFPEVADLLGITPQQMESPLSAQVFSGNHLVEGMYPYAACYGGHQFGHWAGQLGDGRAITLAEVLHNEHRWDIQLKGAGRTPYSRSADGRAVLRSSIREFLCSEAMFHLGIPTTRALSLVATGDSIVRDMFYDGHPEAEPGAIVCRVAPSFIRFGNFEILAARQELELLNQFIDFTIDRDFPHLVGKDERKRADWFKEICETTAHLMVEWQRVGFVHGVMNTDNLSILGLTIDYGPYGWLDNFDPNWTPNTTDAEGRRYAFANQPRIARWNLANLANTLASVMSDHDALRAGIEHYDATLQQEMSKMQSRKFGFKEELIDDSCIELINDAYKTMYHANMDFTLFFRRLAEVDIAHPSVECFNDVFYHEPKKQHKAELQQWLDAYSQRVIKEHDQQRVDRMNQTNPIFILRNYLSQQAIDRATEGDHSELHQLMDALKAPYTFNEQYQNYYHKRPQWAEHKAGCSMLSCSS